MLKKHLHLLGRQSSKPCAIEHNCCVDVFGNMRAGQIEQPLGLRYRKAVTLLLEGLPAYDPAADLAGCNNRLVQCKAEKLCQPHLALGARCCQPGVAAHSRCKVLLRCKSKFAFSSSCSKLLPAGL